MSIEHLKRIKDLRELIPTVEDISEREAYLIQLETLLPKPTKKLYIDADGLIYKAAYSPVITEKVEPISGGGFVGTPINNDSYDLEEMFNNVVKSVVDACKYESLMGNMTTFKDYVLVYTPSTNFRYDVYPEYKKSRFNKPQSNELIELKALVKPKGLIVEGVEADDIVSYYGKHGHPIASGDKDVIYGVAGNNFFYHKDHFKVYNTTVESAKQFLMIQCIAGDSADDIPGIKGVGMKTKLLPENATFDDVINVYLDKGMTKEDAITTRRLVDMNQWKGQLRGLKLFNYEI